MGDASNRQSRIFARNLSDSAVNVHTLVEFMSRATVTHPLLFHGRLGMEILTPKKKKNIYIYIYIIF